MEEKRNIHKRRERGQGSSKKKIQHSDNRVADYEEMEEAAEQMQHDEDEDRYEENKGVEYIEPDHA